MTSLNLKRQIPREEYFEDLTVGECIGGGGVAIVYRGIYRKKPIALKTLFDPRVDAALRQEFMDELLVMSKLHHPSIVSLIGACLEPPNLCIVMELCDFSLHHMLHATGAYISTTRLLEIATQVASGMKYLHSLSPAVIHRDLKSQNVLIDARGDAKLCDFGLVKTKITSAGTPSYMPPELLANRPFNKSVDVYMFGVLLWEIFTRDIPYRGYDVSDIRRKILDGDRPRIPTIDCPESCQRLMRRCWDADPNRRPNFDEVYDILKHTKISGTFEESNNIMEGDSLDCLLGRK